MTWPPRQTVYLVERTTTTLQIPLLDQSENPVDPGAFSSLKATLTWLKTSTIFEVVPQDGPPVFEDRDVLASLDLSGVLSLTLSADDLAMVSDEQTATGVLALSAVLTNGAEWHDDIWIKLRDIVGVPSSA